MARHAQIKIRVSEHEKLRIEHLSKQCNLAPSTFLRRIGLSARIQTTADAQLITHLAKLNGDLGRVGGLLKLWLSREHGEIEKSPSKWFSKGIKASKNQSSELEISKLIEELKDLREQSHRLSKGYDRQEGREKG